MVLAAGLGMRLRPLTLVRAKPAIPIGGEPLIRRILSSLASAGVTGAIVNLHHLPVSVTSVLGDGADLGLSIRYSWEQPLILGSAGGVRRALDIIGDETFAIVNGDTLTDFDLEKLASMHQRSSALVTLALVPNREPDKYGGVRLDDRGRVTGFVRRGPAARDSFHFVGIQIANAGAFADLPLGSPVNSVGEAYDALIARRPGAIAGCVSQSSEFWDIGTVQDYVATSLRLASNGAPAATAKIDPTARVDRSILWNDVEVGAGAVLERCIVTDGVRVPVGASYRLAILRAGAEGAIIADEIPTPNP
jgi:mannose-1-phosphate guanylyltransferase